jgi:hypothetical protein
MRRFIAELNPFVRGILLVALVALVVVVLSLEEVLAAVGGLLRIAFFLAIAFFLFLLWKERRADLDTWSERGRRVFYAAVVLAVVDLGVFFGLGASGPNALAFLLVLAACAYVAVRVWRREQASS